MSYSHDELPPGKTNETPTPGWNPAAPSRLPLGWPGRVIGLMLALLIIGGAGVGLLWRAKGTAGSAAGTAAGSAAGPATGTATGPATGPAGPGAAPGVDVDAGAGSHHDGGKAAADGGKAAADGRDGRDGRGDNTGDTTPPAPTDPTLYDIVIADARVMDPETDRDETGLNIGISGDTIVRITNQPLKGQRLIDAQGLVVAPGFIDPQSYEPNEFGSWYKVADGVTTNLSIHDGLINPDAYWRNLGRQQPPLNYGASFYVGGARRSIGVDRYAAAGPNQIRQLVSMAERALDGGAMGVSFSLEYYPNQQPDEVLALVEVAARYGVPAIFHVRYSTIYGGGGTNFDALTEVLDYARATGAAIHIGHLHSTGGTFSMAAALAMLAAARAEGLDVTADIYSYDYWATNLSSARFAPGWQERFQIDYADLQLVCSQERMTAESFTRNRAAGGVLAVAYAMPPAEVPMALAADFVMLGSDGILEPGPPGKADGCNNHPRGAGNYARLLGKYVREDKALTLMDALAKTSLLPAQRFEARVPALARKGRLQAGMDADVVIFDADQVLDTATVEEPARFSAGIHYVLVNGQIVVDEDGVHRDVRPGRPLRAQFHAAP